MLEQEDEALSLVSLPLRPGLHLAVQARREPEHQLTRELPVVFFAALLSEPQVVVYRVAEHPSSSSTLVPWKATTSRRSITSPWNNLASSASSA